MGRILLLWLIGGYLSSGYAAMELPPVLRSAEQKRQHAEMVMRMVPEVMTSSNYALVSGIGNTNTQALMDLIGQEQSLVQNLIVNARFQRMAQARPPLQTLKFQRVRHVQVRGQALNDAYHRLLEEERASEISFRQALDEWMHVSPSGFFSGWAPLLEREQRSLLSEPDIQRRWSAVKRHLREKPLAELRQRFRAQNFGVDRANWNWADLDGVVERMVKAEKSVLITLDRLGAGEGAWLLNEDYAQSELFRQLDQRTLRALENLRDRTLAIYADSQGVQSEARPERELVLRELPPYLAIYRGAVGNDCSTMSSWPYPYAPTERNWWIESSGGRHLGYVSGALTEAGGRPTLYIRDVVGMELLPGDVELILDGFYLARNRFGARQMTVMQMSFIRQNHNEDNREALENYIRPLRDIVQTFADQDLRESLIDEANGQDNTYDKVSIHTEVRLNEPPANRLENVHVVEEVSADAEDLARGPGFGTGTSSGTQEAIWLAIAQSLTLRDPLTLQMSLPQIQAHRWIDAFRNSRGLRLEAYYRTIETLFRDAQLPWSRNQMRRHRELFLEGHLRAPDAFNGDNAESSIRFITDLLWRTQQPESAQDIIAQHLRVLEKSEVMIRAVKGLFERRQAADVNRVKILWNAGFRFQRVKLSKSNLIWIMDTSFSQEMTLWAIDRVIDDAQGKLTVRALGLKTVEHIARLLDNHDTEIDESISVRAAEILAEIEGAAKSSRVVREEMISSIEGDSNVRIFLPLAIAYLRDKGTKGELASRAAELINDNLDDSELPHYWRRKARSMVRTCEQLLESRKEAAD